jgi:hypothetical protein
VRNEAPAIAAGCVLCISRIMTRPRILLWRIEEKTGNGVRDAILRPLKLVAAVESEKFPNFPIS